MLALVTAVKSDGGATAVHSAVLEKSSLERQMFEPAFFLLVVTYNQEMSTRRFGLSAIASSFEPAMQS